MKEEIIHISDYTTYSYRGKVVALVKNTSLIDNKHGVAVSWDKGSKKLRVLVGTEEEYFITVKKTTTLFALWNMSEDVNILYVHD